MSGLLPIHWFLFGILWGAALALAFREIADTRRFQRDWEQTEEHVRRAFGAVRGL